jgi:predicted ferric reductase
MRRPVGSFAMLRAGLVWLCLAAVIGTAFFAAATSPLLAWRDPVYILASFTGVVALALLLVQALLIAGFLPGLAKTKARHMHRWLGGAIVAAVAVHVGGLWVTSPPDVIDALLFASPTMFSFWGVVAMWAVFASATLAIFRRQLRWRTWRNAHVTMSLMIVAGTIAHAIPIEGTMEHVSKVVLCGLTAIAALGAIATRRSGSRTANT